MYEPLHHKYRPQTFAQLVGQGAIADTLTHALQQNRIAPAYLFCGPRGTGKTSSARILAKSLNCLKSDGPTPTPCGQCDVCRSVSSGSALDIVEIDAASNTGVDNIRELIERAQFAPVQCRYKAYVIDECLIGSTQVTTDSGSVRIDDPSIVGRKVLSYNEQQQLWELKKVVRRYDQGKRQTYIIETDSGKIGCTGNHLIRTEKGWIAAKDVKEGMKILSPASVDAGISSSNTVPMAASEGLRADISSKAISSGKKNTIWQPFSKQSNPTDLCAPVAVEKSLKFQPLCARKGTALKEYALAGRSIPTKANTATGKNAPATSLQSWNLSLQRQRDLYTGRCLETVPLPTPIHTAGSLDLLGHTVSHSSAGWNTRPVGYPNYDLKSELPQTRDMEKSLSAAIQLVILSLLRSIKSLSQTTGRSRFLQIGWILSRLKELLGGTWMTDLFSGRRREAHVSNSIRRDSVKRKIKSLLAGCRQWDTLLRLELTKEREQERYTRTSQWEWKRPPGSYQTSRHSQSRQCRTSLATVKSVQLSTIENVYDIEVEDNHNFVANGLLVHNCHMLSTAAFNALLKTLEEPPERVVFVLATTDPQRVLPTIISRCQRFDFRRIPLGAMVKHLGYIAQQEVIAIDEAAIQLVAQIAQGGLRDAESLLDQLSLRADEITVEAVWDLVGAVPERDLLNLVKAIAADDSTILIERTRNLMDKGREPLIVLQSLVGFYRDLLIAKSAPQRADMVAITPPTWAEMTDFAQKLSASQLLASQQRLQAAEVQVKNTTQPRLWLEITLTSLLPSALGAVAQISSAGAARVSDRSVLSIPNPPAIPPVASISAPSSAAPAPATPPPATPPADKSKSDPTSDSTPSVAAQSAPAAPSSENTSQPDEEVAVSGSSRSNESSTDISEAKTSGTETSSEAPVSSEPPAVENAGVEVAFGSVEELWTKILAALAPRGTQMLMSQQGLLLAFDGVSAKVGFRSAKLQKMAQQRVPNLEKAFEAVFQRPIRVSIEVQQEVQQSEEGSDRGSTNSSNSSSANAQPSAPPSHSRSVPPPPRPAPPVNNAPSNPPPNPSNNAPSAPPAQNDSGPDKTGPNKTELNANGAPPSASRAPSDSLPSAPSSGPSPDQWATNQDQDNIKRFAQFFNGQIVNLDDEDVSAGGKGDTNKDQNRRDKKSPDPGPDVPF